MGGRGRGWGRRGTAPRPATGRRRAHFHRGGAPRPAPGRLGRPAGKVARGGCPAVVTAAGPPFAPSVTAPRQQRSPNPGAEGASPLPPRSPPLCRRSLPAGGPLPARGAFPAGRAPVSPGGPGRPSHGATALPPRPASSPGWVGAGRTVPSAPRAGRAVGPGGSRLGRHEASARGPRRCRPPTRPVLKHGPRSLTRARVRGSHESRRGAMKVKAALAGGRGGIPRPLPVRRGRTTGPSRPPRRGGGA